MKPRQFGESSSESEDECEHCFGHVELRHKQQETVTETDPGPSNLPEHDHKTNDDPPEKQQK